jgi:hypothetical protein
VVLEESRSELVEMLGRRSGELLEGWPGLLLGQQEQVLEVLERRSEELLEG